MTCNKACNAAAEKSSSQGRRFWGQVPGTCQPLCSFRDGAASRLEALGYPLPLLNGTYWAAGAIVVLCGCAAVLGVVLLLGRKHLRAHVVALGGAAASLLLAMVILALTPSLQSHTWRADLSAIGTASQRGPCTHWEGVHVGIGRTTEAFAVGPAPHCQLVTRLSRKTNSTRWQNWVRRVHIYRIHRAGGAILVGGTFGGRRVGATTEGGRLVVVALRSNDGYELWRRSCGAPSDGEHGIAFGALGARHHGRAFVRLRCRNGSNVRFDAATGRRVRA